MDVQHTLGLPGHVFHQTDDGGRPIFHRTNEAGACLTISFLSQDKPMLFATKDGGAVPVPATGWWISIKEKHDKWAVPPAIARWAHHLDVSDLPPVQGWKAPVGHPVENALKLEYLATPPKIANTSTDHHPQRIWVKGEGREDLERLKGIYSLDHHDGNGNPTYIKTDMDGEKLFMFFMVQESVAAIKGWWICMQKTPTGPAHGRLARCPNAPGGFPPKTGWEVPPGKFTLNGIMTTSYILNEQQSRPNVSLSKSIESKPRAQKDKNPGSEVQQTPLRRRPRSDR